MRQGDREKIETAADDSVRTTLAARSATNEANIGISGGVVGAELQRLMDRVAATHQDAVKAAQELAGAVAIGGVESISEVAQSTLTSVESAKTAADQLIGSGTRTAEQAKYATSTREADEEAVAQLTRLKAAFHVAPELETIKPFRFSNLLKSFPSLDGPQAIGLLAGGAIFVLAAIGLVVLGFGILQTKDIVDKLSVVGYARGLITYILAIGTVAVALVLVVSSVLGTDPVKDKDNFDRGKQILTVLIGIFGTILGFYFGSTSSAPVGATPAQSPSPSAIVSPLGSPSPSAIVSPLGSPSPPATVSPLASPSPSASVPPQGSPSPSASASPSA